MDWICIAENTNKCVAVVNTLMDYGLNKIKGILWLAEEVLAIQEEECAAMELVGLVAIYRHHNGAYTCSILL